MNFGLPLNQCQSLAQQDFMWLAEYDDGTFLSEFDIESLNPNNFNDIDNEKLVRYGLIGRGMKFYYEKSSGTFKLVGQLIEVSLKTTNYEFFLTGYMKSSDAIHFKNLAYDNTINQYNFGYSTTLNINGFIIDFKVICSIPFGKPIVLNFEATTNADTDGIVRIRKNGDIIEEGYKILRANTLEKYVWEMK